MNELFISLIYLYCETEELHFLITDKPQLFSCNILQPVTRGGSLILSSRFVSSQFRGPHYGEISGHYGQALSVLQNSALNDLCLPIQNWCSEGAFQMIQQFDIIFISEINFHFKVFGTKQLVCQFKTGDMRGCCSLSKLVTSRRHKQIRCHIFLYRIYIVHCCNFSTSKQSPSN